MESQWDPSVLVRWLNLRGAGVESSLPCASGLRTDPRGASGTLVAQAGEERPAVSGRSLSRTEGKRMKMKQPLRTGPVIVLVAILLVCLSPRALAYEVVVGLGSTADESATIAMGDGSAWPMVAEHSWGPLANLVPIGTLPHQQQQAVFDNFARKQAISELPYPSVRWNSSQPDLDLVRSFGFTIRYVFVLYEYAERVQHQGQATADALAAAGVIDSMLTEDEILQLKSRFAGSTVLMNTRSWTRNQAHLESVQDALDGICVEFMANNSADAIAQEVAPFAVWAHNHDKDLLILMPPLPTDHIDERYVKAVTQFAQAMYDANLGLLPPDWMARDRILFAPANYTFGASQLPYVPEDGVNTVLAAAKQLLEMRPQLGAGPVIPDPDAGTPDGGLDADVVTEDGGVAGDASVTSDGGVFDSGAQGDAATDAAVVDAAVGDGAIADTGQGDSEGNQAGTWWSDPPDDGCTVAAAEPRSSASWLWLGLPVFCLWWRRRSQRATSPASTSHQGPAGGV